MSAVAGCRGSGDDSDVAPVGADASPSEVVAALHEARTTRRHKAMRHLVSRHQADAHVPVILAIDRTLASNRALVSAAKSRFGAPPAKFHDLSVIGNSYGVFSREIRVIREEISGDKALVMIQCGDTVPLSRVDLERVDGRWMVLLEAPEPGLSERLNQLADALDQMRQSLDRSKWSYREFDRAVRRRVWPKLDQIARAPAASQPKGE